MEGKPREGGANKKSRLPSQQLEGDGEECSQSLSADLFSFG